MTGRLALRAVLFDAVGTLLVLREPVGVTYARLARPHGVELPASRIEEAFGRVLAQAPPMAFPGQPPARVAALERSWWRDVVRGSFRAADAMARFDDFEAFFDTLWRHYAGAGAWSLAPGAREALAALGERGLRLGLVSNFDQRLRPLLVELGIRDHFEVVVLPADVGAPKPDPAPFARALDELGLGAAQALYVGDRGSEDVEAARAAGLRAMKVGGLATLDCRIAALLEEAP